MWEMAGTPHTDAYLLEGLSDPGDGSGAVTMFGLMRAPSNPFGCDYPIGSGPHHWIVQAAYSALDTWIRTLQDPNVADIAPPQGPLMDVLSDTPVVLNRDAIGNGLGGIRSPHVDVPVATLDSLNTGPFFCRLFGRTLPLTSTQILSLYPDKADFMSKWVNAINASVADGFLLPADAVELEAAADAWAFPN
ncbi:MAG: alpha/beta hydrolase domain-containing protein [Halioglobus sp.]